MTGEKPRCAYCRKPSRSHAIAIHPGVYAAAFDDETLDPGLGRYEAFACHACWTERDLADLGDLDEPPADMDDGETRSAGTVEESVARALRDMRHEHVRFELTDE